jgi:LuxR family maltose regulon positive regulatory protein
MGTPRAGIVQPAALVPRKNLVEAVLATPPGGVCLLLSQAGYGRRTVLGDALGEGVATVALPPREIDQQTWHGLIDRALGRHPGASAGSDESDRDIPWLVVLDLDPVLHADLVPSLVGLAHELPPTMRIAVTSSPELRVSFSRLRGVGRVVELDGDDLALTPDESRALLDTLAPALGVDIADHVLALCDGWVAALRSASLWSGAHPAGDLLAWLRSRGAEDAWGTWLDRLDADTYEMLLDTAILDQLQPDLVDVVCGSGGRFLPALASPGGPVRLARRPHAEEGHWFERHPLLTSALRYLGAARPSEAVRHRRAADWYLERGVISAELEHRLLAGDAAAAVDRFHQHENELIERGMAPMALRWYRALPEAGLAPQDLLREAWAYALSNRLTEARRSLDRLRLVLRSAPRSYLSPHPVVEDLDAEADVLDAWFAENDGDLVRMAASAARAQSQFGGAWATNSQQVAPLLHARALVHLGDLSTAERILTDVRGEPFLSASVGEGRRSATEAELAWMRGDVVRARSAAARLDRWLRDEGSDGAAVRWAGGVPAGHLARAEGGDLQLAVAGLAQLAEHARLVTQNITAEVLARIALSSVLGIHQGPRAGLEQLMTARALVLERRPDGGLLTVVAKLEARLRLVAGDPRRAEQILRGLPPDVERQLLLARAALQRGLPTAAASVRAVVPTTPREQAAHSLLLAWGAMPTSRSRTEQQLLRAADICAEHGMTTLLVDVPEPVLVVARRTASYHVHEPLVRLVETAEAVRAGGDVRLADPGSILVGSAMTRGDLQLLALLPSRDSNAQIAERLGISVNTVKTRLKRLYAKLGAHDRDEAVARARAAGLMSRGQESAERGTVTR